MFGGYFIRFMMSFHTSSYLKWVILNDYHKSSRKSARNQLRNLGNNDFGLKMDVFILKTGEVNVKIKLRNVYGVEKCRKLHIRMNTIVGV